jgi:hypothetical protein
MLAARPGRSRGRFPVDTPPLRVAQLVVCGVDLGHLPVGVPLQRPIAAGDVRVMLTRKAAPGGLDRLQGRVQRQPQDGEGVSRHPVSLPVRRRRAAGTDNRQMTGGNDAATAS